MHQLLSDKRSTWDIRRTFTDIHVDENAQAQSWAQQGHTCVTATRTVMTFAAGPVMRTCHSKQVEWVTGLYVKEAAPLAILKGSANEYEPVKGTNMVVAQQKHRKYWVCTLQMGP